ncbi:MAG: LuxR C-terminal-related transcriptional regulator [Chloroflexota bacterium]|nr:LuxR C-terminal-related transcriptional regulator [Chloroflexota bacterium]
MTTRSFDSARDVPLLQTKLYIPPVRSELVSRPRLIERLNAGLHRRLTLISAPAGSGKTTLVASCIANSGMPVAWLSLDKDDNLAGRFLSYLVAALQQAGNTIGSEAPQLVAASQQAPPEAVLTSLINELDSANTEIALVLDDYQFINSQAVHEEVAFLLEHCPKTFHLVIATRSDPPLPLALLRARGHMVELRAADLRFTDPEAAQFLNDVMGLGLDAGSVAALEERTEGWIAGLQMAALSMRGRKDVDILIRAFAGTHRFIMDYLLEEVLAREPEEVQAFLLQTAILTRLAGPLCDAVTDASGGQEMLERLERRNLFVVPLDDDRRWYRYHHLFADLLQARLYQSGPDRVARLLSRAVEWCEGDGQIAEAVGYALAAQDYRRAADLIARYWHHTANKGEIETVWSWLEALPEDTVRNSAPLGLAYCWVLWLKGQLGAIEAHLVDAENALSELEPSTDDAAHADLPAHLAVLRSTVARYGNDFEAAVTFAERALRLAPENLPPQANAQLRTVTFMALASAHEGAGDLEKAVDAYAETIHWSRLGANAAGVAGMTHWLIGALWLLGRLRAADEACREALSYLQEQGMARLPATGILHLRMSEVLLERNDLEAAETHLSRGIELGKWSGRFDAVRNAAPALARLRQARCDASGALAAVQEAESAWGEPSSPLSRAGLLALKAGILVRQRALSEAARCVEEAVHLAGQDRGQTGEKVALAASRVTLAQGQPDKAVAELTQSLAAAEASGRFGVALELRILRSLALVRRGDIQEAQADLERALALAKPEGYVRIFLDEGQPMQMLLAQWLAHADVSPLRDYAIRLLSQFDAEPLVVTAAQEKASPAGGLIEPLSQREMQVLHLIALGRTNKEIARQLVVAPGTVKAHTSSIYRKLDVANRTEAVARARQLGILP